MSLEEVKKKAMLYPQSLSKKEWNSIYAEKFKKIKEEPNTQNDDERRECKMPRPQEKMKVTDWNR